MIQTRLLSSLDKLLPSANLEDFAPLSRVSVLRGEQLSFQLAFRAPADMPHRTWFRASVSGSLAPFASLRLVAFVPSQMPVYPESSDDDYISKEPGLFPDLLEPLKNGGAVPVCNFQPRSLWVTVKIPTDAEAGEKDIAVTLEADGENVTETLTVQVIPAVLPPQNMLVTQWFHTDSLASYYHVPVFSEEYWRITENFARTAVENGINTLLTPVFTPPLDTAIGHERPTVQLVGVKKTGEDYSFDFQNLDRWIEMCNRVGVKMFEISHLFSQWGAAHAPKIMGEADGKQVRLFGWESDASSGEYPRFLRLFLQAFLAHMKARGDDKRCIFHISDEPGKEVLSQYTASRAVVADILKDYTVMDALSNIEFWKEGVVTTPIPASNHIEPFLEAGVPNLWTYYCCGQCIGVSNRLFAMPGARTRYIGFQFYRYNIVGFLQWGYNFYWNQGSLDSVNPYLDSTGDYFVPSGDAYSVYPSPDGKALESMRIVQFFEGLQDERVLRLAESLCGREAVIAAAEEAAGSIVFSKCVCDSAALLSLREKINSMIAAAL